MKAYVDGEIVALEDATIPLLDRGYLVGDGLFETMRATDAVHCLDDHRRRIQQGASVLGYPDVRPQFDAAVAALLDAGQQWDASYLRIQITAGPMNDITGQAMSPSVTGFVKPLPPKRSATYEKGLSLETSRYRIDQDSPLAGIKTMSFLPYIAARRASQADDAMLLNVAGRPTEATTSNLFVAKDGVVYAPGPTEGAVDGVTRKYLIQQLDDVEASCAIDPKQADEVWVSNTTGGPMPVASIDGLSIGNGKPGPLWKRMHEWHEGWVA